MSMQKAVVGGEAVDGRADDPGVGRTQLVAPGGDLHERGPVQELDDSLDATRLTDHDGRAAAPSLPGWRTVTREDGRPVALVRF